MDENITKIVCPPLKLLQPALTLKKQNISTSIPTVSTSSPSTQAQLLPSSSTISESQPPIPTLNANVPSYLQDQGIVKKPRDNFPAKSTETSTSCLDISKPNIRSQAATISAQKFCCQKTTFKTS
ncbi:hypothetical protein TNCV_2345361 [Trichonephila clavipes]|nr:hypothetical protein TNCV_2345361 [Trichonephila clavipes]